MAQTYTSASTSINKGKLPAVYGRINLSATDAVFDFGCGRYIDHIRAHVESNGALYIPFDPYNQPDEVTVYARNMLNRCYTNGIPVTVVCSNVLNVIDDETTIAGIAYELEQVAMRAGGSVYVTVYEGDRSGIGRQTGKDSYQRNEPLRAYLKYFSNARISNGMIIVKGR